MAKLHCLPDNISTKIVDDVDLLHALLHAGVPHAHACGGNGRCSTCRVLVLEGVEHCQPRNEQEQWMADRLHFAPNMRLACQTHVSGDIKVRRLVLDDEDMAAAEEMAIGGTLHSVGEEKQACVLFADIRGFTAFAESLPAHDVIHVLNRYFRQMGRVISHHGGYIDNYMGDGVIALFGIEDPTDAPLHAVKAGLGMLEAVAALRDYLELAYGEWFQIGIGLNYGDVVVGGVGAGEVKKVTAIGDTVNFTSRIEAATKELGASFLISESTHTQVREHINVGRKVRIKMRGRSGEHNLYEVLSMRAVAATS
jgi:adenylate cyclase